MPPGGVLDARTTQSSPVPGFAICVEDYGKDGGSTHAKTWAQCQLRTTAMAWYGKQSSRGSLRPASENHRVVQRGRKFALEASN